MTTAIAIAINETFPSSARAIAIERGTTLARLVDVGKTYGSGETAVAALSSAALDIRAGEVTLIEGPSGSGKTTLISILGLLLTPSAGEIWLEGKNVAGLGERALPALRARNFGFVFQGFNLFPALSAVENVAIAIRMKDPRAKNADAEARRLLELVGLGPRMRHLPADLSGGQKQRVAIARALIGKPRLILADEPTGALDSETSTQIMDLLSEIHRSGITVLVVSHDADVAARTQRTIRLKDGKVMSPHDLLSSTSNPSITIPAVT